MDCLKRKAKPNVNIHDLRQNLNYLSKSLKDLASAREINRKTGVDFAKFEEHINNVQEMVNQRAMKKYPGIEGETDVYLSSIASGA
jgi:hypothetical protein